MKLNLFLLCIAGIAPVTLSAAPHSYHLIKTPMTWSAAQNYCRETYDDLAEMSSFNDWLRIAAEAGRNWMIFPAWIGLYNDVDSWRWSSNNLRLKDMTLRNWNLGQPSNGSDACGAIDYFGYWYDYQCTDLRGFVCYDSIWGFINYPIPLLNWAGAQFFCRQFHRDLATATNSMVNNQIKNQVLFLTTSWFGLYRDTWTWTDGTIAKDIPWALFQPDKSGPPNCGTYALGLISDETCSDEYAFYCHSTPPVRQQQMISLQVQSGGSVLDPVVQSSILDQLKQMLKKNGMNVTVTWKVQQDAKIFKEKKNKKSIMSKYSLCI